MKGITFSVIIPSYNQSEYLSEAIWSVFNQTHIGDVELIIVDDGSTDESLKIATGFHHTDIQTKVITQVNKGLSSARNTGIMNARGRYIIPLDADDSLHADCLKKIYEVIQVSEADVIAPSIHCFGLAEQDTILMPAPSLEDFKKGNRLAYCAAIKRDALLEIGGYSPRMTEGYEDLHLWINLLTRGKKIVTVPEALFNYRTKENSMWKDSLKHHEKLMAQIYKDFPAFI